MDKYLALIPKNLLAFLAIAGGIAFIIFAQPPASICDSQLEVVNEAQKRFLFHDPKEKGIVTTKYERLRDHCKVTNAPGGCYEFFQELKTMIHDLGTLPKECADSAGGITQYKSAMWQSMEMMVRLGWGEAPPATFTAKFGWLDSADMSLFCKLKDRLIAFYGEEGWDAFRERMMRDLPGAQNLPRNQVWDLSLFSENCSRYP